MTGQKSLAVEKQVIFVGTWKSVKLTDFCLKEIQMQEGRNEGCMCLLQLSLSGLFVFSKDGAFKTGLEKGISLNRIYTIASKRKRPRNLMCLIEEGGNKFTVLVFRCITSDDSILLQNTLRQLWEVEYCPVVLLSKRGRATSRKSRPRSALRHRSSSHNESTHLDSEKIDPKGGHLFVQNERQRRSSRYGSPPKSSFYRRSKSQDGSQHRVHWRPVALSSIGVQSEPLEVGKYDDDDQANISIDVLKKELKSIFTEIHDIRRFLEKSASGSSLNQADDEENHYGDVTTLPLLGSDGNDEESNGAHIAGYVTSEEGSSLELVGASELSDTDDEYIMARRSLISKPHSGYFLEKSMRYEPDYLKSDPLYGKLRKNRNNDDQFVEEAGNMGILDELSTSRRHTISMSNTQRRHQENTKNIRDSTESSGSDGLNPTIATLKRSRKDEYFYIPYRTKPIGMDYYAGVRTVIRKPIEQAYGKKDKIAFRVRSFSSSDPRKKSGNK